jgi:3-oxoadipate enol-lactonase
MEDVIVLIPTDDAQRLHVIAGSPGHVPLVLSNSLGTNCTLWDAQFAAFTPHHSVWRYDTRGHGESDAPAGEYSLERLGKDLIAVIDATAAEQVDLCGVSIGGLTALWTALHAPGRVRRLILANTAARIGDSNLWSERIRTARTDGMSPLAHSAMLRWFTESFCSRQPGVVSRFRDTLEQTNVDGYVGCCAALRDADLRSVALQVTCPTLIVTGTHDVATPAEDGRWLAGQIAGASVVELDAAHLSNVECAGPFNAAVWAFLTAA